ncbi:MAG: DUF421 domain-containing protein [Clostridia bacterium]|nr:DUF421 domain-containing protein [Clostridia bacterium]
MFTLFFRGALLYIVMIVTMRALGKRQLGEFEPYELAMTILLADLISSPMESVSTPLLHGLLPVAAMFVVHGAITLASLRWDGFRALVSGKPAVVIRRGEIDQDQLDRLCLSLSDLLEGLRGAGFLDPAEVGTAIVEANGTITAFPAGDERPPKAGELNITPGYEGLPMTLIADGRVQPCNLRRTGLARGWLEDTLRARSLSVERVYLASLDTQGRMTLQIAGGGLMRFQAIAPKEVAW